MLECKFSYKQKVKVTKGFYNGYTAIVQEVSKAKDDGIEYKVKLETDNKTITLNEDCLKSLLFGRF